MAVFIHSTHLLFDDLSESIQHVLVLFRLIITIIVFVENNNFSVQVIQRKNALLLKFGNIVQKVILFELFVSVFHLGYRLGIAARQCAACYISRLR
jgi:hypothetical protein